MGGGGRVRVTSGGQPGGWAVGELSEEAPIPQEEQGPGDTEGAHSGCERRGAREEAEAEWKEGRRCGL